MPKEHRAVLPSPMNKCPMLFPIVLPIVPVEFILNRSFISLHLHRISTTMTTCPVHTPVNVHRIIFFRTSFHRSAHLRRNAVVANHRPNNTRRRSASMRSTSLEPFPILTLKTTNSNPILQTTTTTVIQSIISASRRPRWVWPRPVHTRTMSSHSEQLVLFCNIH